MSISRRHPVECCEQLDCRGNTYESCSCAHYPGVIRLRICKTGGNALYNKKSAGLEEQRRDCIHPTHTEAPKTSFQNLENHWPLDAMLSRLSLTSVLASALVMLAFAGLPAVNAVPVELPRAPTGEQVALSRHVDLDAR